MKFQRAVEFVLSQEGLYCNDPNDPGGETKYGISKRSYPSLDIAMITLDQAVAIYRKDFWDKCKCEEMPYPVALAVFDAAVNQGVSASIRALQKSLGVVVDGVIGTKTLAAITETNSTMLLVELVAQRCVLYATLSTVKFYGLGWFRRVSLMHSTAMSEVKNKETK